MKMLRFMKTHKHTFHLSFLNTWILFSFNPLGTNTDSSGMHFFSIKKNLTMLNVKHQIKRNKKISNIF